VPTITTAARSSRSRRPALIRRQGRTYIRHTRVSASRFAKLASNQLFNVVVGFVLTGIVGGLLTNYYAIKQHERDVDERRWLAKRALFDELGKMRVLRIAEVWEKVFAYESSSTVVMNEIVRTGAMTIMQTPIIVHSLGEPDTVGDVLKEEETEKAWRERSAELAKAVDASLKAAGEARVAVERNRLWLGEVRYRRILQYLAVSADLLSDTKKTEIPRAALTKRADELRDKFSSLREEMWNE
jgi:hypothetical protein